MNGFGKDPLYERLESGGTRRIRGELMDEEGVSSEPDRSGVKSRSISLCVGIDAVMSPVSTTDSSISGTS